VRVALALMAAAGVVGTLAAQPDGAVAHVLAAFALLAEAVVLKLQHGGEGKRVVGAGDVDVLRADAGVGPQDLARVLAGHRRDRPRLIVHVRARLAHAARNGADQHSVVTRVLRAVGARYDDGRGVVGLHAAVEQVQRLADHATRQHVFYRQTRLVEGLGIVGG